MNYFDSNCQFNVTYLTINNLVTRFRNVIIYSCKPYFAQTEIALFNTLNKLYGIVNCSRDSGKVQGMEPGSEITRGGVHPSSYRI